MINDQLSTVSGRFLRPRLLAIEPNLVPSSQAAGSARHGSALTAHCSWARCAAAAECTQSAGALFTDIRSVYYSIIRQYVVGFEGPDDQLRAIMARLSLSPEVTEQALLVIHKHGSLLQERCADPDIKSLLRDLNDATWFVIDGSEQVAQTLRGARFG